MKRFDSLPRLELGWSEGAAPRGSTAAAGVSVRRRCCRTGEGVGSGGGGRLGGWGARRVLRGLFYRRPRRWRWERGVGRRGQACRRRLMAWGGAAGAVTSPWRCNVDEASVWQHGVNPNSGEPAAEATAALNGSSSAGSAGERAAARWEFGEGGTAACWAVACGRRQRCAAVNGGVRGRAGRAGPAMWRARARGSRRGRVGMQGRSGRASSRRRCGAEVGLGARSSGRRPSVRA